MKRVWMLGAALLLAGAASSAQAERHRQPLIVTASNDATANELLVYDTAGRLRQRLPTQGQGGVSGNAGGIAVNDESVAVVNFGSASVTMFERDNDRLALTQVIGTASAPVSVAFGKSHLYVLGTTTIESHRIERQSVDPTPDGVVGLLKGDGSAAQVGVTNNDLIIAEKSNTVETVELRGGAVVGQATAVEIPANSDTPFGLVTRGSKAYVTIAHSDEVALFVDERLIALAATGTPGGAGQHAPCWVALDGPFLFSANSPSQSISRFTAVGNRLTLSAPVAAQTASIVTDIAAAEGRLASIDSDGTDTHVSQFTIDDDGNLTRVATSTVRAAANGVAIIN